MEQSNQQQHNPSKSQGQTVTTNLVTDSDIYCPFVNENKQYVDKIPSFTTLPQGLRCVCGARRDKTYNSHTIFAAHIKSKTHAKWLAELNVSHPNLYKENQEMKTTVRNQQMIISRMDREISDQSVTIRYLSRCVGNTSSAADGLGDELLLDFD